MHQLANSLKLFILAIFVLFIFNTASFAQSCSYTGSWDSNFGKMKLTQSGNQVTGTTPDGKISGTIKSYGLKAVWWRGGGSYNPPTNGGEVVFYISPDCKQLAGDWRQGTDYDGYKWNKGGWTATRIYSKPKPPSSPPPGYSRQPDYIQHAGGYGLPTYSTKPVASSYNWNGVWSTKTGNIRLTKTGTNSVEGSYTLNSSKKGVIQGIIKGTIKGNQIIGFWSEGPTYTAPKDAGEFYFTMAPDSNRFTGQYRYGYAQHNRQWKQENTWNGTRLSY